MLNRSALWHLRWPCSRHRSHVLQIQGCSLSEKPQDRVCFWWMCTSLRRATFIILLQIPVQVHSLSLERVLSWNDLLWLVQILSVRSESVLLAVQGFLAELLHESCCCMTVNTALRADIDYSSGPVRLCWSCCCCFAGVNLMELLEMHHV